MEGRRWRWYARRGLGVSSFARVVGAAALAAALCSLAPTTAASAQSGVGSSVFVHSARSGELTGGRLTLRGVSRRVTAISSDGRSGVVSVTRLQSRLFLPGQPVTGVLHVAGFRGGDEPTFSLTQPRYNASRRTVSYVAKRLNTRHLPRRGAGAAQSFAPTQFGAVSLSMAAPVGDGGNDCETSVGTPDIGGTFFTSGPDSKWDTDTWVLQPNINGVSASVAATWQSDGGFLRGCSNTATFTAYAGSPDNSPTGTVTITTTWPWTKLPTSTCSTSTSQLVCTQESGVSPITWQVHNTIFGR
jgi:hypothetical protein